MPVYNDVESLNKLLEELGPVLLQYEQADFSLLLINDGSDQHLKPNPVDGISMTLLHLNRNIGHQKAIAVGLAYIKEHIAFSKVLIMDADGEDRPADVGSLLAASEKEPQKIIFGHRSSRQEAGNFRLFYSLYKLAFRILTGRKISFGNFLVMPKSILEKAVYYSEIWNHLAGGILKTGLPYTAVNTDRGKRYLGKSRMNFQALLLHGLGAIAVFIEVIATRLLVFSITLIFFSLLVILAVIGIKTFTELAIPGWTSTVVSAMLIVLLQSFLLSLFTIFLYLSSQSQRKFIPAKHYTDYMGSVEIIQ